MTLEDMKKHEWSVSWSGGKDSTATIILMHEYGIPIKEIVYVRMMYDDTLPATLPVMTDFVDSAIKVFEGWGYNVKVVKSIKTAEQIINTVYKRSKYPERNGKLYGVTCFGRGFCKFTDAKQKTIKSISSGEYQMIGYACDEVARLHRLEDNQASIMAELGVTEQDTFDICKKYNLLSPLYKLGTKRDGCWFCPNACIKERQMLKEEHPELVQKVYNMIEMCDYDLYGMDKRNNWVADYFKENDVLSV